MSKEELQAQEPVKKEEDIDNRLKETERRIKELQILENERKIKELEKQAELADKIAQSINAGDTQLKVPGRASPRDPGDAYDDFIKGRETFEEAYGITESYNVTDPKGWTKTLIASDIRICRERHPEFTDDQVKEEIIKVWSKELSML